MKKHFLIILMTMNFVNSIGQEVSLMTYNIRLDIASDEENAWSFRKDFLVSQLELYMPDIFGIQEGKPNQVNFIDKNLGDYHFIGEGRDGGENGEFSAIFYNEQKYKLLAQKTFWLSETPLEVSKGWDAAFPRICTYGLFMNKVSGIRFFVFNTHLDHIGIIARSRSLQLILKKIDDINTENLPVVLMGDFNMEPKSEEIVKLSKEMDDCKYSSIKRPFGPEGTFNAFNFKRVTTKRIDYIFVSKSEGITVNKYGVLNNSYNLKYPSDHFPVYVEIELN